MLEANLSYVIKTNFHILSILFLYQIIILFQQKMYEDAGFIYLFIHSFMHFSYFPIQ